MIKLQDQIKDLESQVAKLKEELNLVNNQWNLSIKEIAKLKETIVRYQEENQVYSKSYYRIKSTLDEIKTKVKSDKGKCDCEYGGCRHSYAMEIYKTLAKHEGKI